MKRLYGTLLALATALFALPALAGGPFDSFRGSRAGGGSLTFVNGQTETIRCTRRGSPNGNSLSLTMRCASASFKVDMSCNLTASDTHVSGSCHESNYGVGIRLNGSISGSTIHVRVATDAGSSGTLTMPARGGLALISANAKVARRLVANLD